MRVTVYCGAASGKDGKYQEAIERLGEQIAQAGDELVYGGGGVGLMGAVARAVYGRGARVHGIIPEVLLDRDGVDEKTITELEIVPDMDVRKRRLMEASDVLIAFPGGAGTLEEIAQAFSWARIGLNDRPCVFYDLDGFWQPLRQMLQDMVSNGFVSDVDFHKMLFTTSYDEIREFAASYEPPIPRTYPKADSQQ